MPKSLGWYLHTQALGWHMPGLAVRLDHGRGWHRYEGELPGWTTCGLWASEGWVIEVVGKGQKRQSPWDGSGHLRVGHLCESCFEHELPLLCSLVGTMHDERDSVRGDAEYNDRLREALERYPIYVDEWDGLDLILAAARRFLALTETGPDYEAAMEVYANQRPGVGPVTDRKRIEAVVDAAVPWLSDYEEET